MAITLSMKDIKKMPLKAKVGVVVGVMLLIGYFYWFFFLSSALTKKNTLSEKLATMEQQINEKSKVASKLDKYKSDVAALQENYKIALQKLPDQREIPSLFHSVAMSGKEAGVEFLLFEPKASVPKSAPETKPQKTSELLKPSDQRADGEKAKQEAKPKKPGDKKGAKPEEEPFYEEIPVEVSVAGTFQNTLYFFDKVAKLPRIINVSDISIGGKKEIKSGKGTKDETPMKGNIITSSFIIKTYMFIDKQNKTQETEKPGAKKK